MIQSLTEGETGKKIQGIVSWAVRHAPPRLREDARQAVWVQIVKSYGKFDESKASLTTFLEFVARGAVLDFLRREDPLGRNHRRHVKAGRDQEPLHVPARTAWDLRSPMDHTAVTNRLQVDRLLQMLSGRDRHVIISLFFHDRDSDTLAAEMGIAQSRVYQLRADAIEKMRKAEKEGRN